MLNTSLGLVFGFTLQDCVLALDTATPVSSQSNIVHISTLNETDLLLKDDFASNFQDPKVVYIPRELQNVLITVIMEWRRKVRGMAMIYKYVTLAPGYY